MKTIYAYTGQSPAVGYVGYINVRQHVGGIAFTVRSEGKGDQGEIVLTPEQCEALATDLLAHLHGEAAPVAQPNQMLVEALKKLLTHNEELARIHGYSVKEIQESKLFNEARAALAAVEGK